MPKKKKKILLSSLASVNCICFQCNYNKNKNITGEICWIDTVTVWQGIHNETIKKIVLKQ